MTNVSASAFLWVVLMGLLAFPIPFPSLVLPERGAPILYLTTAGALVLFWRLIAPASIGLAAFLTYALAHVLVVGFPIRGLQLLVLMAMAGLLFAEAVRLSPVWARRVGWAFLAGAGLQAALGLLNLMHVFPGPTALAIPLAWIGFDPTPVYRAFNAAPWMTLMSRDYLGRPMGWLTHPNYWGSYLALAVPVAYVLLGRLAGVGAFLLVLGSVSIGPVVSAAVGLAVVAWRDLTARQRWLGACAAAGLVVAISVMHVAPRLDRSGPTLERKPITLELVTSGRSNVWAAAVPKMLEAPFLGHGVGTWRLWADEYNRVTKTHYITQQAHNEVIQLQFELGLIGLALGLAVLLPLTRGAVRLARAGTPDEWMWAAVAAAALVNSIGSPTLHLPTQAGVAVFAAARLEAARRSEHAASRQP